MCRNLSNDTKKHTTKSRETIPLSFCIRLYEAFVPKSARIFVNSVVSLRTRKPYIKTVGLDPAGVSDNSWKDIPDVYLYTQYLNSRGSN
jgi:hypothetical protein